MRDTHFAIKSLLPARIDPTGAAKPCGNVTVVISGLIFTSEYLDYINQGYYKM